MQIELRDNELTAKAFMALRESVGWGGAPEHQIESGLANSIFNVAAKDGDQTVGMGRLVGDRFSIWYIQDVIVLPVYQGRGIGKAIINRLMSYIESNSLPGTVVTVGLMAAKGKEAFYTKLGFHIRPNDSEGAGMVTKLRMNKL
jgi:GNAT superfamily N-acetyltransferase